MRSNESPLLTCLSEIATIARRQTYRVAAAVYHANGDAVDKEEFKSYSESAAYIAFVELGGDPEAPIAFDWKGRRHELLRATQRELRKILKGADQGFDDARLRSRIRPDRACVREFQWQSWGDVAREDDWPAPGRSQAARNPVTTTEACDAPTISAELDDQLHELGKLMAENLSEKELTLLTEHYFNGRTQQELARELAATNPRYAGRPDAEARAYNWTLVNTHRARKKLKDILGERWLRIKRELEDVA